MNIQKYTYRLDESKLEYNDLSALDSIALHHMDHPTANIDEVTGWHMDDNKWDWIGYGYWIGFDGVINECRGYNFLNAAVKDNNTHIISIGFQGQYNENNIMPPVQFNSAIELIKFLKDKFKNIKTVHGHKNWNPTTCPGDYFPLIRIIKRLEAVNVNLDEAIKILLAEGVINNAEFREKVCDTVMYEKEFVINVAKKILELKK